MMYDLQKASLLKRFSAFLLDAILISILVVGVAMALSGALDFDSHYQSVMDISAKYETQYGVSFDITREEYDAMSPEEQQTAQDAYAQFANDQDAVYHYNMMINLSLVIVSLSILASFLLLEFAIPAFAGNGQTIGKKIFGIALMKNNGVKINAMSLFIRTLLGKFTIETMIPVLILIMIFWGVMGIMGPIVIGLILLLQVILMITSRTNAMIHDCLAQTVAVDIYSQMIFASEEERVVYKRRIDEEMVRKQDQ